MEGVVDHPAISTATKQPSIILDISKDSEDLQRFLAVYTGEDGSLRNLVLIAGDAVFRGSSTCVEKPASKRNLSERDHLSKVKRALMSVASPATSTSVSSALLCGGAASAAQHGRSTASSALPVTIVDTEAVLTVKEALKGGPSFVVLATARLRRVDKGIGALLIDMARAAFTRGQEASRLKVDLGKANDERKKLRRLLDQAINDKRKVIHSILERAVLVINAKKAMIANLQDASSNESSEGDDVSPAANNSNDGGYQDKIDGTSGGVSRSPPSTNRGWRGPSSQDAIENFQGGSGGASSEPLRDVAASKAKGKMARARHGHVASSQGDSRVLSRAGRSVGRAGGIDRGKRMQDEDEDDEDDDESDDGNPFWGMGSGGGALAALPGTQEVSGEDLVRHIDRGGEVDVSGRISNSSGGKDPLKPWRTKEEHETGGGSALNRLTKRARQGATQQHNSLPLPSVTPRDGRADRRTGVHSTACSGTAGRGCPSKYSEEDDEEDDDSVRNFLKAQFGATSDDSDDDDDDDDDNDEFPGRVGLRSLGRAAGVTGGLALGKRRKKRNVDSGDSGNRKSTGATIGGSSSGEAGSHGSGTASAGSLPRKVTSQTTKLLDRAADDDWDVDDLQ